MDNDKQFSLIVEPATTLEVTDCLVIDADGYVYTRYEEREGRRKLTYHPVHPSFGVLEDVGSDGKRDGKQFLFKFKVIENE